MRKHGAKGLAVLSRSRGGSMQVARARGHHSARRGPEALKEDTFWQVDRAHVRRQRRNPGPAYVSKLSREVRACSWRCDPWSYPRDGI